MRRRQPGAARGGRHAARPRQTYNPAPPAAATMIFEVGFRGHPNVRPLHRTTIEVTTDACLTPAGDCIVGVGADCGCAGLPDALKAALRDGRSRVRITLIAGGREYSVTGRGDPRLELSHPSDIVARRSSFACPRTLAVECDGSAAGVPPEMAAALRAPGARGAMRIEAPA